MTTVVLNVWIYRISLLIAFWISLYIIYRDYRNRKLYALDSKQIVLPKYLKIYSNLTIWHIPISILLFLSYKIPYICIWTYTTTTAYLTPKTLLTLFQIARLQLCFSQSQIHSSFGYPKCVFICLYFVGFLLILYIPACVYLWLEYVPRYHLKPANLGCDFDHNEIWAANAGWSFFIYTLWDLMVLFLYIYKIRQAKRRITDVAKCPTAQGNILSRINGILNKILFLTIIYEIISNSLIHVNLWIATPIIHTIMHAGWAVDYIATLLTMYLFLEHNESDYLLLLRLMKKFKCLDSCCCCFKLLPGDDNLDNNGNEANMDRTNVNLQVDNKKEEIEMSNIETRTLGGFQVVTKSARSINYSIPTKMEIPRPPTQSYLDTTVGDDRHNDMLVFE